MIEKYQIMEMYSLLWDVRAVMEGTKWSTPTLQDSCLFLCTEIAEAIDAKLRESDYARNNDKDIDFVGECADVLIMAFTAARNAEAFKVNLGLDRGGIDAKAELAKAMTDASLCSRVKDEWSVSVSMAFVVTRIVRICPAALGAVRVKLQKTVEKHG